MTSNPTTHAFPSRFGLRGRPASFVDPSREDSLPEVGQDRILGLLGSLTGRSLAFGASLAPRSEQTLLDLLEGLDPLQDRARSASNARALLGGAREEGAMAASALARQGYGRSAQMGAQLDALNRGSSRAQASLLEILSPESRLKRRGSILQLIASLQAPPTLSARSQAYGLESQRRAVDQQGEGGFFGSLADILGAAGPYLMAGGA